MRGKSAYLYFIEFIYRFPIFLVFMHYFVRNRSTVPAGLQDGCSSYNGDSSGNGGEIEHSIQRRTRKNDSKQEVNLYEIKWPKATGHEVMIPNQLQSYVILLYLQRRNSLAKMEYEYCSLFVTFFIDFNSFLLLLYTSNSVS